MRCQTIFISVCFVLALAVCNSAFADCKCWDDHTVITGSITVSDVKLCETKDLTSSMSDPDHWYDGSTHSYPYDSFTYTWSKSAGTNPQDGTWGTGGTNSQSVSLIAPCYTGTINIRLDVDDKPDPMDDPCDDDSERDDPSIYREDTLTVSLPGECNNCTGDPVISLEADAENNYGDGGDGCSLNACGAAGPAGNISTTVLTPCYSNNNCKWRFGATATADYPWGPCTLNYTEVAGPDDVNSSNYCAIVDGFDYDPQNEATGTGCVDTGGTQYSNADCLDIHEQWHVTIFMQNLEKEEADLREDPAFADMTIVCGDPNTETCGAAKSARENDINAAVDFAYTIADTCDEVGARDVADQCFKDIADLICNDPRWDCGGC